MGPHSRQKCVSGLGRWFTNIDERALLGTQGKVQCNPFETSVSSSRPSGLSRVVFYILYLLPQGYLVSSRDIFDCHDWQGATGILWLETKSCGNSHDRELHSSNVHSAVAEDPCPSPGPRRSPVPHTAPGKQ